MTAIISLQWYQYLHDDRYHRDIAYLPPMQRLRHLLNHLVKYNANLEDENYYHDSLACIFSMANAFNVSLSKKITTPGHKVENISDFKPVYHSGRIEEHIQINLKTLSKASESWDHLESYPYREKIEEAIANLFTLTVQKYCFNGTVEELIVQWMQRLEMIKTKHCFHRFFHSELIERQDTYRQVREIWLK